MDINAKKKLMTSNIPQLFPSLEHWQSFLDLTKQKDNLHEGMIISATQKIRQHFQTTIASGWTMRPRDAEKRDTEWYLTDFGPDSITVVFNWYYLLSLHCPTKYKRILPSILQHLELLQSKPLEMAFDRIDGRGHHHELLKELRNFSFGHHKDGNFDQFELAYLAHNNEQSFVDQAIAKIERFTNSSEVTQSLAKLNKMAEQQHAAAV